MVNNGLQAPQVEKIEYKLIDGSIPMTSDQLIALLGNEGIAHQTEEHPPMRTVDDAKALRAPCDYGHTKNLFVRNKKGEMWLLTLHEDRQVDLKTTAKLVGTTRFSFASERRLMDYLGVTPGAVSAFSMLNDVTGKVRFYCDEVLLDMPALHIHPLVNTRTTTIERDALFSLLSRKGHQMQVLTWC